MALVVIKPMFTEEQYHTLMDVMQREYDAEFKYQEESIEPDCTLLDKYISVIDVLEHANIRGIIDQVVADELVRDRREKLQSLKERMR